MATAEMREPGPGYRKLLLALASLAAAVCAVGFYYYRNFERGLRAEVERQLSAIAELKRDDLARWRRERLSDAETIFGNSIYSGLVRRVLQGPEDAEARRMLQDWMNKLQARSDYERILLLDTGAAIRMSAPEKTPPIAPHLTGDVAAAVRAGRIEFLDFHRDIPDDPIHLTILVPLFGERDDRRPLGVLAFRIDPFRFLYPFIQKWPTPSRTAETLLVRREGNDAVFLNELRFRKNTALNLRIPLEKKATPAVRAVLGHVGIIEGIDYRGVPVLADVRAIPESPWFLVSRMDIAEVNASLRQRIWLTILLMAALMGTAATGIGLLWWKQRLHFFRLRLAAAEALHTSEQRYRRLFESAKDGILILDAETGTVVDVNPFLIELLGFSHQDFLDKKIWELGFLKDIVANQDNFAELQRKEYLRYEDMPLETRDGRRIEVEFVSNVYLVNQRKVIQCNIRDITGRKRTKEELQKRNDEMTRFTYAVSHDLKSPLVTIKAFLGYLEKDTRDQDTEAVKKDLGFIHGAVERMSRLLDELLDLARVGHTSNPTEDVTLQEVVKDALDLVAGRITGRGVAVAVTAEPATLHGDRERLVEVFQNLVENAIKFMGDQSAPRVEIGVEKTADEMVFFVRDNGIGIDPRHKARLFGLFEKLDPGAEGSGIGLALVKRIVEVHGGRIWVVSGGLGQGSTFRFTLPGKDGV